MHGDYGVIVKQGKFPARYRRDQLGAVGLEFLERVGTTEWLVHLIDGREVWLWTDWLANV